MKNLLAVALIAIPAAMAADAMPAAQQNVLIKQYCTVCHTDAFPNGKLSLQHFDAAHPDAGIAAMMASKLKAKALGASGQPLPDRAVQDALLSALTAESAGAETWIVNRTPLLTAAMVQQAPAAGKENPTLYRLTVTCNPDTRQGEMQLSWSPGVPKSGQPMLASVDGTAPLTFKVEGAETMGNGQAGTSGPGAATLSSMSLPEKTLTVSNLFADERVVFAFSSLRPDVLRSLSACFPGK